MIKQKIIKAVKQVLTPDLLKQRYRNKQNNYLAGHCYVASEAIFHLLGGKEAGYKAMFIKHEGEPHWWLLGPNKKIIDVTVEQFKTMPNYKKSRCIGFLTKQPSKRAVRVIERVINKWNQ